LIVFARLLFRRLKTKEQKAAKAWFGIHAFAAFKTILMRGLRGMLTRRAFALPSADL